MVVVANKIKEMNMKKIFILVLDDDFFSSFFGSEALAEEKNCEVEHTGLQRLRLIKTG